METVYLRALELSDLERVRRWHNDSALYETLGGTFHHVSSSAVEEWLRRSQSYSAHDVNLAICLAPSGEHIGNLYLRDIDWVARRGELHVFIGDPEQRSRGYGRSAIRAAINHAFEDLGLHRLYLFVLADNLPAAAVYRACGFAEEGRLRHHAFKRGVHKDVLVMGLVRTDLSHGEFGDARSDPGVHSGSNRSLDWKE